MRRSTIIVVGTNVLFWRYLTCIQAAFFSPQSHHHRPSSSSSPILLAPRSILCLRHGGSMRNFPTFVLRLADDDDEMAAADEKISTTDELLKELNDKFDYEGRMPMGGNSVVFPTNNINAMDSTTTGTLGAAITDFRCGFVVVLGAPNMGKSTLVNALLQQDLCITTARPQTTRHAILGILGTETCQVCLVDTPGILENPAYMLQQGMMEAVVGAFHDADVLLVVTDLFSTPIPNDSLFAKVQASNKPVIVAVNKIDLAKAVNPKSADKQTTAGDNVENTFTVEEAVARWRKLLPNAMAIIPMTASSTTSSTSLVNDNDDKNNAASSTPNQQDAGVQALRRLLTGGPDLPLALRNLGRPIPGMFRENTATPVGTFITDDEARALLPISPPLYDQEILTDRPERFIASELIRAALFGTLAKELPYCCEVRIRSFKEPKANDNDNENDEHEHGNGSNKKKKKPVIRIEADVVVERDSQKKIVIGQKAEMIKLVGTLAREKLEDFFQSQVYLQLNVKVDKDWRRREDRLKEYGYLKSK